MTTGAGCSGARPVSNREKHTWGNLKLGGNLQAEQWDDCKLSEPHSGSQGIHKLDKSRAQPDRDNYKLGEGTQEGGGAVATHKIPEDIPVICNTEEEGLWVARPHQESYFVSGRLGG